MKPGGALAAGHHLLEQIAGIRRRMNLDESTLKVSHETIYTARYAMPRGALRTERVACLGQARKSRRPRARGEDRRGSIPNMTSIHQRPPQIDDRIVPGHWEGDLIKGARNASAVATLVERTTLLVTLARLDNASADAAVVGFSTVLNRIDAQRRLSLTYDQGRARWRSMSGFPQSPASKFTSPIRTALGSAVSMRTPTDCSASTCPRAPICPCSARPRSMPSPWQLNTQPRKSLDWNCLAELFMPESFDFFQHHHQLVALRT